MTTVATVHKLTTVNMLLIIVDSRTPQDSKTAKREGKNAKCLRFIVKLLQSIICARLTRQQQDDTEREKIREGGQKTDVHREKFGHGLFHRITEQRVYVIAETFCNACGA